MFQKHGYCGNVLGQTLIYAPSNKYQIYNEHILFRGLSVVSFLKSQLSEECEKMLNDTLCHLMFKQCEIINNTISKQRDICLEACLTMKNSECKKFVDHIVKFLQTQVDGLKDEAKKYAELFRGFFTCNNIPYKSPNATPSCYYPKAILGRHVDFCNLCMVSLSFVSDTVSLPIFHHLLLSLL